MTDTKIYHAVPFVAKRFGVSDGMIYRLCESGKLGHLRIGSRVRISEDDIKMFEKKNHVLPQRERIF